MRGDDARGETLIELLLTIAIMGIAVIGIVFGMGVAVKASDYDRKNGRVENLLRNYAETISAAQYVAPPSYSTASNSQGDTASVTQALCWNANPDAVGWVGCGPDTGVQQLTLQAQSTDGRSSKTLVIVKRDTGVQLPSVP